MEECKNFIPDMIKVGRHKYNSNYMCLTMKRRGGAWLFASDFVHYTGYTPVDKPRDAIISFERDATDKVRSYENIPTSGFKIGLGKIFHRESCIQITDPRGWTFCIRNCDFFYLINNGVDITGGILNGEFVYSVVDDYTYNLVLVNSRDYQIAIKEHEQKSEMKKLRASKKLNLIEGRVYDYLYDKKNTCRAIYMGKMPKAVGYKLANWYKYSNYPESRFNQERHVWLLLIDNLYQSRYINYTSSSEPRFNLQGSSRVVMKYDSDKNRIVRQNSISVLSPLRRVEHIIYMYFDDYFNDDNYHNFEFRIENIVTVSSIDKLNVVSESTNQSYQIEKANKFRINMNTSFKDASLAFPVAWQFDDLKKAILSISEDWYKCHCLRQTR